MRRRATLLGCLAVAGTLLAGCGGGNQTADKGSVTTGSEQTPASGGPSRAGGGGPTPSGKGVRRLEMRDIEFAPSHVTVRKGQSIAWDNKDSVAHTVTADSGGDFDSGNVDPGAQYEFTPTQAGEIHYYCTIHGRQMSGTITVKG